MWNNFETEAKVKPAANILENEKEYKIQVTLPGWSKNDVKVEIEKDLLVLSGNVEETNENKEDGFLRKEFKQASFERSFSLPKEIDHKAIVAEHKDGILEILIPKNLEEREKMKRLIKVK
jgi:HSP20 family protein